MARKFLYAIATLIVLIIAAAIGYRLFGLELMRIAMIPKGEFAQPSNVAIKTYADSAMWIARPDIPGNPSQFIPKGAASREKGKAAIFFIHPTSYITFRSAANWNAELNDKETNERAALFVRGQASALATAGDVWAPRYRQANFGAFLTDDKSGVMALDAAYADVLVAFDHFVAGLDLNRPIILAGHSQGALHLMRIMKDRVALKPVSKRIVAAYVIGWPVSEANDIGPMGLPECKIADQSGCILAWQSFGEPAETDVLMEKYNQSIGLDGRSRRGQSMVCTNPLTGSVGGAAPATANRGMLKNNADFSGGVIIPGAVPARCDKQGFLLIGEGPELGPYVLPGNNYHVYDFSLFWVNIGADARRRLAAYSKQ